MNPVLVCLNQVGGMCSAWQWQIPTSAYETFDFSVLNGFAYWLIVVYLGLVGALLTVGFVMRKYK